MLTKGAKRIRSKPNGHASPWSNTSMWREASRSPTTKKNHTSRQRCRSNNYGHLPVCIADDKAFGFQKLYPAADHPPLCWPQQGGHGEASKISNMCSNIVKTVSMQYTACTKVGASVARSSLLPGLQQ
jgi:hypothetical protein